eukprot:CAMPEP_0176037732 /NCGR_PEP_ID=MMETSP0120_2-20121206/18695_1 /TAXON_ID=160619 /ORGANISM="Kryptoperidinium foliaceum, Strain CCMP 1326" /LENGTH=105 /DNA_ID=CAMNT_0017371123 /DNA_START=59 /DNA_END=376 /DNA_ORIENTATION=-
MADNLDALSMSLNLSSKVITTSQTISIKSLNPERSPCNFALCASKRASDFTPFVDQVARRITTTKYHIAYTRKSDLLRLSRMQFSQAYTEAIKYTKFQNATPHGL